MDQIYDVVIWLWLMLLTVLVWNNSRKPLERVEIVVRDDVSSVQAFNMKVQGFADGGYVTGDKLTAVVNPERAGKDV